MADKCPPEIELEKERELEKGQAARAYGRYRNVFLTDGELAGLQAELPGLWQTYVDRLSEYMASTGRQYRNHAATIRRWAAKDSRYRSRKPMIITTNLRLEEIKNPPDLAHVRIYDRILERCAPVLFAGKNFREGNAEATKSAAKEIISQNRN